MYSVRIYPHSNSAHVSQIYAGLYDLQATGKVKLKISLDTHSKPPEFRKNVLWSEVTNGSTVRHACFDMEDSGQLLSMENLRHVDKYFKRSYEPQFFQTLPSELSRKILPYGLNYPSRSQYERGPYRIFLYNIASGSFKQNPLKTFKNIIGYPLKLLLYRCNLLSAGDTAEFAGDDFVVEAEEPAERKIFFQTRIWSHKDAPYSPEEQLRATNQMRIDVVRRLKKEFGDMFVGGITRTPLAEKECPDCIAPLSGDKKEYLSTLKKCLVAVTTTGLHQSTGWKLAEYVASARCIVTEPLEYALPNPLEENKNIITFHTPEECVQACRKILDDPDFARQMRKNNAEYYQKYVKPSQLIDRCLTKLFEDV